LIVFFKWFLRYWNESKVTIALSLVSGISLFFSFLSNSYIAKQSGAVTFGQYNFLTSIILLAGSSAPLGLDTLSFSLFNQNNPMFSKKIYFRFSLFFTLICSTILYLLILALLCFFYHYNLSNSKFAFFLGISILFQGFMMLGIAWLRISGNILTSHILANTIRVACFAIFLIISFNFYNKNNLESIIICYGMSFLVTIIPTAFLVYKYYPFDNNHNPINLQNILNQSLSIFWYEITFNFYQYADVLILELLNNDHEMGEYVMARKLALFATFFNTLMGTRNQAIFSKLYFENNLKQLNAFIKMQCRIAFFLTFLSGFAILILSYYYINWLGNDFTHSYLPLSILLLGEIIEIRNFSHK